MIGQICVEDEDGNGQCIDDEEDECLGGCKSPITQECSSFAPCPAADYCYRPLSPFIGQDQLPFLCDAYPDAMCKFTGCGGCFEYFEDSQGNIYTLDDCQQDICLLNVDSGPCEAAIPSWYYDSYSNKCKQFNYGGCAGNGNRFDTKRECRTACRDQKLYSSNNNQLKWIEQYAQNEINNFDKFSIKNKFIVGISFIALLVIIYYVISYFCCFKRKRSNNKYSKAMQRENDVEISDIDDNEEIYK